jgi:hypothetical protein
MDCVVRRWAMLTRQSLTYLLPSQSNGCGSRRSDARPRCSVRSSAEQSSLIRSSNEAASPPSASTLPSLCAQTLRPTLTIPRSGTCSPGARHGRVQSRGTAQPAERIINHRVGRRGCQMHTSWRASKMTDFGLRTTNLRLHCPLRFLNPDAVLPLAVECGHQDP